MTKRLLVGQRGHKWSTIFMSIFLAALKKAAYSSVRVTHILLLTGVFQGHECRSNGSILGAWGTFKFFLEKIFDAVIRSNMAAIFFSP